MKGNKYSHLGNLFSYENYEIPNLTFELNLDSFLGIAIGDFPFRNDDLYGGDVLDWKTEISTNLTLSIKSEILNFFRFEYEFEFVPFIAEFAFDSYETMSLGDNCMWAYYKWNTLLYETRIRKKIKECGFNLKSEIEQIESLNKISSIFDNLDPKSMF